MTDLLRILPSFPTANFAALLPAIEHQALTTTDLLTLHPADIAKQTHLPLLDLKRFVAAIQASLTDDLKPRKLVSDSAPWQRSPSPSSQPQPTPTPPPPSSPPTWPAFISTLDPDIDAALGGGVPTGRITEFTGESGAGKTQFLLSLCLAVQLPPPYGLSRQALYISTESSLSTSRLAQMLRANPLLKDIHEDERPSLDNILSTALPDLESQDHILQYQLPVLLERHSIGLIVLDSVAANYRAEFENQGASRGSKMAARSSDLVRLGALLRDLARRHDLAVVVANQVGDRFEPAARPSSSMPSRSQQHAPRPSPGVPAATQETPLASRSTRSAQTALPSTPASPIPFSLPDEDPPAAPALDLDHQQRWFTGWGDDPTSSHSLKTPSLGLVWTSQIACRVALLKRPAYGLPSRTAPPLVAGDFRGEDRSGEVETEEGTEDVAGPPRTVRAWRRWMKVVFAPHAEASEPGTEGAVRFEITLGGLKAIKTS